MVQMTDADDDPDDIGRKEPELAELRERIRLRTVDRAAALLRVGAAVAATPENQFSAFWIFCAVGLVSSIGILLLVACVLT